MARAHWTLLTPKDCPVDLCRPVGLLPVKQWYTRVYVLYVGHRAGKLFHIDFGFILGRDPKPLPPPMRLSKEMVEAMGGPSSEHFADFKRLCYTAFLHLRRSLSFCYTVAVVLCPHLTRAFSCCFYSNNNNAVYFNLAAIGWIHITYTRNKKWKPRLTSKATK